MENKNVKLVVRLILIIAFFSSCKLPQQSKPYWAKEIENLKTIEDHKSFLDNLFQADQKLRQGQDFSIMLEHGRESEEYNKFLIEFIEQDSINLLKTEKYLKEFGYPNKDEVGELEAYAPWAVIHHSAKFATLKKNFHYIYNAFKNGSIDESSISLYLNGMYEIKYRNRFHTNGKFDVQEEIDSLIKVLELESF